jgi:hypothetical protein
MHQIMIDGSKGPLCLRTEVDRAADAQIAAQFDLILRADVFSQLRRDSWGITCRSTSGDAHRSMNGSWSRLVESAEPVRTEKYSMSSGGCSCREQYGLCSRHFQACLSRILFANRWVRRNIAVREKTAYPVGTT